MRQVKSFVNLLNRLMAQEKKNIVYIEYVPSIRVFKIWFNEAYFNCISDNEIMRESD